MLILHTESRNTASVQHSSASCNCHRFLCSACLPTSAAPHFPPSPCPVLVPLPSLPNPREWTQILACRLVSWGMVWPQHCPTSLSKVAGLIHTIIEHCCRSHIVLNTHQVKSNSSHPASSTLLTQNHSDSDIFAT